MKQKSKQNPVEFLAENSCCLRHHVARNYENLDCWPNMLKFTISSTKEDVDEILRVEVSHGSTRPLNVCKVCAGYIYCLLKQFCETVCVASSEA